MRDEIGHLAIRADGLPFSGLCHCGINEAHYADPGDGISISWYLDFGGAPHACRMCGKQVPGGGHSVKCIETAESIESA